MTFKLQFPATEITAFASRYRENKSEMAKEQSAFAAREGLIQSGRLVDLMTIGLWKSHRRAALLCKNSPDDIKEACRMALATTSPGCAVAVLQCLYGVLTPMASAILTVLAPQKYTIIDVRALKALGQPNIKSIRAFPPYLAACQSLAEMHHVSLRELDQAMWTWAEQQN